MNWYLVHTKPRQERCALENLIRQGYECYLPMLRTEKIRRRILAIVDEPLFPRYLFIRLGKGDSAKSWSPIRSTLGVSRLVCFGVEPATVNEGLIEFLRSQELSAHSQPKSLYKVGERLCITEGPFAGIEGIYQMTEGEQRVMVLIELMSKPVKVTIEPTRLRKVG